MNARPDEGSRDASSGAALREAERLFSKSAAMRAAAPLSEGTNRPKNADHQHPSRRDAEATAARPGAETKAGEKRRQGRISPTFSRPRGRKSEPAKLRNSWVLGGFPEEREGPPGPRRHSPRKHGARITSGPARVGRPLLAVGARQNSFLSLPPWPPEWQSNMRR
jgi:hypothetical protein